MVVVQFAVVVLRYVFGIGSIWLSESIIYGHAALFMLAAAWTLREGGHVRVDVFYADAMPRTRALIDLCGALFLLLPFMLVLAWFALPYVARSWAILETSPETSGIPAVFLLKTLIPLFAMLMALQGIAQAIRALEVLAVHARRDMNSMPRRRLIRSLPRLRRRVGEGGIHIKQATPPAEPRASTSPASGRGKGTLLRRLGNACRSLKSSPSSWWSRSAAFCSSAIRWR